MDEEDKLVEETQDMEPASDDKHARAKHREEAFPPKMKWWERVLWFIAWAFLLGGLAFIADQLCFKVLPPCVCCTYIAFGFVLSGLIIDRWICHELIVHKERLEDISEVEALFVEAATVERPTTGPMADQQRFERKRSDLNKEVRRLQNLGNRGWTEYQVLSLNQMLVDFLEEGELKARARSSLADLEDYAEDSAYRYDQKQYEKWRDDINESINKVNEAKADSKEVNESITTLQAQLRTLLEHVASAVSINRVSCF